MILRWGITRLWDELVRMTGAAKYVPRAWGGSTAATITSSATTATVSDTTTAATITSTVTTATVE